MPPGPIDNVTSLLEAQGFVIVPTDLLSDKVMAVTRYLPGAGSAPIILTNKSMPTDRLRFSLCHEMAHVALQHFYGIPSTTCEEEADRLAGEFLAPTKDIRGYFTRVDLDRLAHLKRHWKMSMQSLIMRAHQVGRLSESKKRRLYAQMSALGYRRVEPVEVPIEIPTVVKRMLHFHRSQLGYEEQELADLLGLTIPRFREQFGEDATGLRLIKG